MIINIFCQLMFITKGTPEASKELPILYWMSNKHWLFI